jgi:hypothetical protein
MSMHSYWIGLATELDRAGDTSLHWILEAAVAGEVFAAGHAEAGNDIPVLMSTGHAERVAGGYRLTGRKQFGSNARRARRRPRGPASAARGGWRPSARASSTSPSSGNAGPCHRARRVATSASSAPFATALVRRSRSTSTLAGSRR